MQYVMGDGAGDRTSSMRGAAGTEAIATVAVAASAIARRLRLARTLSPAAARR
jgi:hypothetical protein